jgi:UDP-N-acetylglucosamine--N-acetylmuramyl-(pentapeptide) pyrophosphoryl-undecaprenol N-acetylglucosamine transferase
MKKWKVILSGGGTGGHIFPAIAIANGIRAKYPDTEFLFIGAEGKMEMEKVPAAGYPIIGLPIRGFQRKFAWSNFLLPFKIIQSLLQARKIIRQFQPDIVIGVGGYASGPTLQMANLLGIKTVIQEQNSFAGKTNQILGKKVNKICVAYPNMEKFFPKDKIVFTGNPVRKNIIDITGKKSAAADFFQLNPDKPTVLIVGGSLGARTLNNAIKENYQKLLDAGFQIIWQSGKNDFSALQESIGKEPVQGLYLAAFIYDMDLAYAMADIVVSRAGAIAVSEICAIGKPSILVPSPNVAEDHQTKNAKALTENNAAVFVADKDAQTKLTDAIIQLLADQQQRDIISENASKMGVKNADEQIVQVIENMLLKQ